jgi:glutamate-ammonia-ligase adenylyltransferase
MKARIERERIPAGEDPQFHLKLGKGSLSDVEWTVQLLQLRHGVVGAGTMDTLAELEATGAIGESDARALRDSYRFCEHTRNRWHLVGALRGGASPGDSLPAQAHQMSRLARSLGTTPPALRDDYRRVTRRARGVMERLFYGIDGPGGFAAKR